MSYIWYGTGMIDTWIEGKEGNQWQTHMQKLA